jgi:hypothetical protein
MYSLNPLPSSTTQPTYAGDPCHPCHDPPVYKNGYDLCQWHWICQCPLCAPFWHLMAMVKTDVTHTCNTGVPRRWCTADRHRQKGTSCMILLHMETGHCSSLVMAFPSPMLLQDCQEMVTICITNPQSYNAIQNQQSTYQTKASERMNTCGVSLSCLLTHPTYTAYLPSVNISSKPRIQTQTWNESQNASDKW